MMPDDQAMSHEWIVRVQGREYGPADLKTLQEWKTEGRLLPENEARRVDTDLWTTAAEIPGLFEARARVRATDRQLTQPPLQLRRRSFGQILADTFQIYRKGFFQFLSLTLLVLLPSICSQLAAAVVQARSGPGIGLRALAIGSLSLLMSVLSIAMTPVYIAGIQVLTAGIAEGRRPGMVALLNEAVRFWPRVAALCLFVYGVFLLLMMFGFFIAAMALSAGSSLFLIFLALALLVVQVWMFGRFFVNVLFWQQFAILENAAFLDALRESRNLARSGRHLPWFQRPLWRGAFIASIWFAFVLVITLLPEWSALQHYWNELLTSQDPQALLRQLTEAQQARGFDIAGFALGVLAKILQPMLGIAFVLLYVESKSASAPHAHDADAVERHAFR
jgi:hypothetical protein